MRWRRSMWCETVDHWFSITVKVRFQAFQRLFAARVYERCDHNSWSTVLKQLTLYECCVKLLCLLRWIDSFDLNKYVHECVSHSLHSMHMCVVWQNTRSLSKTFASCIDPFKSLDVSLEKCSHVDCFKLWERSTIRVNGTLLIILMLLVLYWWVSLIDFFLIHR